ncbi:MAG: shikimate kinase [Armatimonadetes bacterium]|nr:shikimate kinase [Armatimonadota bacterium]
MKNIVLIGFMGTGKSRVGHMVARRLGLRFVDTDDRIVEKLQMPITEVFAKLGEPKFREIERNVVAEVALKEGQVIATGGGVPLFDENVQNLKRNGIIICLTASPEIIYRRTMGSDARPLLSVSDKLEQIRTLLDRRQAYYAVADHQVDTSSCPASVVARKIVELYKADGSSQG